MTVDYCNLTLKGHWIDPLGGVFFNYISYFFVVSRPE